MFKKRKFPAINGVNYFFGSDFHFGHDKEFVYKARGFSSIEEHDNAILKSINENVGAGDVLFYLGDFALGVDLDRVKLLFSKIKCKHVYYVWGNHESQTSKFYKEGLAASGYSQDVEVYPLTHQNVTFLGRLAEVELVKKTIILSHFPQYVWDKSQYVAWHLCGHSHGSCLETLEGENNFGKAFDCGVDNALRLTGKAVFSFDELREIMRGKEVVAKDHHKLVT